MACDTQPCRQEAQTRTPFDGDDDDADRLGANEGQLQSEIVQRSGRASGPVMAERRAEVEEEEVGSELWLLLGESVG